MGYTLLVIIYIYLPMISLFAFSFNEGGLTFPFTGFTTQWYSQLLADAEMINAVITSLKLAGVTTVITTVLSTAVALAFRKEFRGKRQLLYYFMLGLLVPGITYGFGALLFLNNILELPTGFWLAVPIEVVWTLPFGIIILLAGFPPNLAANERAARVMGANRITTFRKVIFPQIWPTILGAALFAFTLAYNEASRVLLVIGSETTMTTRVFVVTSQISPTPQLFALGSVTTIVSTVLLLIAAMLVFDIKLPWS
jgi:putative spermidine/putrescine transport system permease protein